MSVPNGVLVVDKPAGMTSHDVVYHIRKKFGTKRVGHTGTLDPDATGVLVLCVGEATRLIEFMVAEDKEYEGTVSFGTATTTDDASGEVVASKDTTGLTFDQVMQAAQTFVGTCSQRVPAYSAVHIDGRRAYEYARADVAVELPVREIHIFSLQVLSFSSGTTSEARFATACSKGTYIRALCRDWGEKLGLPAHLSHLRRIRAGSFSVSEAVPLAALEASETPVQFLLPPVVAVQDLPKTCQPLNIILRLVRGQSVTVSNTGISVAQRGPAAVLTPSGSLAAIVEILPEADGMQSVVLKPKKVFWKRET